ncbi:unnamed protein product [Oikopleura dioica]|uniref:Uncharacterized protein n=1 Tax=Oikopleura dioica TaxID=34765 RepID=E4WST9_OIKDI|nr:unnamed protein product [Oikopleura dioica]
MTELLKDPEHVKSQEYFGLSNNWALVGIDDLPKWMISSRYLLGSMRPQLESFKLCYSSWFRLHTETGNIWSHFIGFIGFVVLFFVAVLFPLSMSIMENVLICLSVASATRDVLSHAKFAKFAFFAKILRNFAFASLRRASFRFA